MDLLLPHLSLAEKVNQLLHVRARCTRPRQTRSPAAATGSADGIAFGTRIPRRRGAWPPLCARHACRPVGWCCCCPPSVEPSTCLFGSSGVGHAEGYGRALQVRQHVRGRHESGWVARAPPETRRSPTFGVNDWTGLESCQIVYRGALRPRHCTGGTGWRAGRCGGGARASA